jgi:hypothetical protein
MSTQVEGPIVAETHFAEFSIECRVGSYNNYFRIINHKHPEIGLRLYRSSAMKLVEMLPEAVKKASEMEAKGLEDKTIEDVSIINEFGTSKIKLYIEMNKGYANIYLRLFVEKDGSEQPCRYGCKFTPKDNLDKLYKFIISNK